jgi:hypothetical protein
MEQTFWDSQVKRRKITKETGQEWTPESSDSAYGPMTGSSDWGKGPLGFRKG